MRRGAVAPRARRRRGQLRGGVRGGGPPRLQRLDRRRVPPARPYRGRIGLDDAIPLGAIMRLQKIVAIVTGGGSGMGEAIAETFAREGAHIAVVDIDGDAAKKVARKIGNTAMPLQ